MRYIVVWANRPEFHPGDGFAPLKVTGHLNAHYWYREFDKAALDQRKIGGVPADLFTQAGTQNEVSVRWGGCVANTASLTALQSIIAGLRWDEGPTGAKEE